LGIVAYTVWKQYIKPARRMGEAQLPRELSMLLILASGVLYATYCQVLYVGRQPYDDEGLYLSSFLFLPLILGLSLHPWKFFVNGFTKFMGKISFSVYLCHFFVIRIVENLLDRLDKLPSVFAMAYLRGTPLGLVVVFLVVLAISIPLCMFTWKFVEQPGIRFGKRWIRRREERAAALCA
jgi:peptidoglycan/LPS O-acetylase OafA/YrhL